MHALGPTRSELALNLEGGCRDAGEGDTRERGQGRDGGGHVGAPRHHVGVSVHAMQPSETLGAGEGGTLFSSPSNYLA